MAQIKFGIKVPMAVDDYLWVTQDSGRGFSDRNPVLFDTKESALEAAKIWGPMAIVEEYPVDII